MKETIAKWLISSEAFKAEIEKINVKCKEILEPKCSEVIDCEPKPRSKRKYNKKKNEQNK